MWESVLMAEWLNSATRASTFLSSTRKKPIKCVSSSILTSLSSFEGSFYATVTLFSLGSSCFQSM